ncbi:MAG: NAD-dependent epimerase/dehydratase family protein [Pirellulales bacterium]
MVRVFGRHNYPELAASGAELVRGDIRDPAAVSQAVLGCDAVIHTAAIAGIWGPRETYFDINTRGTIHVLNACRLHGIQKLVFTSSPSVTFDAHDQASIDESTPYPTRWLCSYPETKALAEQAVLAANGQNGLLTCALRPHLIWGPGDPHLVPRLLERARQGKLRRVGDGTNLVDMIYVDNAADAHLQALDALAPGAAVCGRAYYLSQGEPVNCWAWINELLALDGQSPIKKSISRNAARRIGAILERVHTLFNLKSEPRMTRFLAAQLGDAHWYDIGAARRDFGYAPRVSTVDGMRRLAEWLKIH